MSVADDQDLPAGSFLSWLDDTLAAGGADVPCGECTACCRSSYFIHVEPDETDTLRHIPQTLQFPAPGRPDGHVVLGYDERGHCPMFVDGGCSIYEHRPRACRRYDCRVFPATGLSPDDDGKHLVAAQARRWRFDLPTELDHRRRDAVRAAAVFLRTRTDDGAIRTSDLAMSAITAHALFLDDAEPDIDAVRAALDG